MDFSRYRISLLDKYVKFKQAQLRAWMLYVVDREEVATLAALRSRARQAFDFTRNPALRGLGLDQVSEVDQLVEQSLRELYERGFLVGDDQLVTTDAGKEYLSKQLEIWRGKRRQR